MGVGGRGLEVGGAWMWVWGVNGWDLEWAWLGK